MAYKRREKDRTYDDQVAATVARLSMKVSCSHAPGWPDRVLNILFQEDNHGTTE